LDATPSENRHRQGPKAGKESRCLPEQGNSLEDIARRLQEIVRDQGKTSGALELTEVAHSSLQERQGWGEEDIPSSEMLSRSSSPVPFRLALRTRGADFVRQNLNERVVQLVDLPRGIRVLALLGYANVAVLLLTLLFLELSGSHLSDLVAFDIDTATPHEVPFASVVTSLVAFIVGWALILTGSSDCSRRVFLPVLGLFVLQMFLLTQVFGEAQWNSQGQVWWATVCVAVVVAGIHLFTHRLRYWRDLPLAEFCAWLLVLLVILFLLLRLPKGELAERVYWLSFFGMIVTTPFWLVLGLEIIDLAVTVPRWFVLGPFRRLSNRAFNGLSVFVLVAQALYACLICADRWGGTVLGVSSGLLPDWASSWSGASQPYVVYACAFELLLVLPLLVWVVVRGLKRTWTIQVATAVFVLSLAAPVITFGGSLALWGGKDFVEAGLSAPNVIPPFLLFAGLLIYDVLNFGAKFANSQGHFVPRNGRVLMYFGTAALVLSVALVNVDEHSPTTGLPGGTMEFYVDFLFAVGVLLFGPPYLAWMVWKRREWLVGEQISLPLTQSIHTYEDPSADEPSNSSLFALAGGAMCGILAYFATFMILTAVNLAYFPFKQLGMIWGAVVLTGTILGFALVTVLGVRYVNKAVSGGAIYALASGSLVFAAMGVFIAWVMLVSSTGSEPTTQTVTSETFQPALTVTTDASWTWQENPGGMHLSRGKDSWLSVLNVQRVYDSTKEQHFVAVSDPEQIARWLRHDPHIRVTSESENSVGGVDGIQLDVVSAAVPERQPGACPDPCIPLFEFKGKVSFWIWEGNRARISILRRGTDTVAIVSQSPPEEFDKFTSKSREVLDTLEWRHLAPGDYTFERFEPPLSLHIEDGWNYDKHLSDWASLQGGGGSYLGFVNVRRVFGPETPNSSGVKAAPRDLVGWFEDHKYLKVENVRTGQVGGVSGPMFEVVVRPLPRNYSAICGESCVPLFYLSDGEHMMLREGYKYHVRITRVEGQTIVTLIQSQADEFDAFLPRAEGVVKTVTWE
jgi:hypothetical protein